MKRLMGHDGHQHYLLTIYDDGTHELATRADRWDSWGPPTILLPVPQQQRGASS